MSEQVDPRASLKGLMALVLDMARADPQRRPSAEMQRWHQELATSIGVVPGPTRTNRELLDAVLRLDRLLAERDPESRVDHTRGEGRTRG